MKQFYLFCCCLSILGCSSQRLDVKQFRASNVLREAVVVQNVTLGSPGEDIVYPTGFVHHGDFFELMDPAYAQKCYLFNADGSLRQIIGGPGQGPGEYSMPWAFTVGNAHIYLISGSDKKNNVYDLSGNFQASAPRTFTGIIQSLDPHPDGAIGTVFSRYCDHTLFTINAAGEVVRRFSRKRSIKPIYPLSGGSAIL